MSILFTKYAWIDRSRSFSFSVASNCSAIATSYHWVKLQIRWYVQMSDHRRAHDLRFLTMPNVRSPTSARSPISDDSICPITDEHTISDFRRTQSSDHRRVHNSRFPTIPKSDHRRAHDLQFATRICTRSPRKTGSLILYEHKNPIWGEHAISDCRRVRHSGNLSSRDLCMHQSFSKIYGFIALSNQVWSAIMLSSS